MNKFETDEEMDDQNIYAERTRELLVEEDSLRPEEDGFMQGYDEAEMPESVLEAPEEDGFMEAES